MRTVNVTIQPNAAVQVHFAGFAGRTCDTERQRLSQALAQLGVTLDVERIEQSVVQEKADGDQNAANRDRNS